MDDGRTSTKELTSMLYFPFRDAGGTSNGLPGTTQRITKIGRKFTLTGHNQLKMPSCTFLVSLARKKTS